MAEALGLDHPLLIEQVPAEEELPLLEPDDDETDDDFDDEDPPESVH